ncbi:MAG: hypothetical protein KOO65_05430 [Desulfobacterales bacterium]|nr:hypothetical protein [Desulfobacterales bacterium]
MNTEFHYWFTGLIAKKAGFSDKEASTIAYASEYVDENDVSFRIKNQAGGEYSNHISQTMNILKPKNKLLRIYPVFHFIPGDPNYRRARRKDGKMHLLNTTPNSENANEIIGEAFKSHKDTRVYRIGIASHSYVDTWAHQNFVGWYDDFNNIGLDLKPDIGHADGEHHPDWISHRWIDNRLVDSEVNNRSRFLSASKALFEKYCEYIKNEKQQDNSSEWEKLEPVLADLMGSTYTGNRCKYKNQRLEKYKKISGEYLPEFDEREWFDEAIKTKVRGMKDSHGEFKEKFTIFEDEYYWHDEDNKEKTDWYRFQEAVKENQRSAIKLLSPTFKKMGVDLSTS